MSYDDFQGSRASGNTVQAFLFRYGTDPSEYYAYTSSTQDLTIDHGAPLGEITYTPIPIERDAIVSTGTLDKSAIRIEMDVSTDLAELFRIYPPSQVVTLTIFEGHLDDPDSEFVVVWAGRVVVATREGSRLQLSGEPISTQMKRPGLRRNYQYGCPLVLYGAQCGADKESATVTAIVVAVNGTSVELTPGWEGYFPAAKFTRGTLEWTPAGGSIQRRTILRVSGDVLTLSGIALGLEALDSVDVVLGCNHKAYAPAGDCEALHDNLPAFGGQPHIPLKNVINTNPYY